MARHAFKRNPHWNITKQIETHVKYAWLPQEIQLISRDNPIATIGWYLTKDVTGFAFVSSCPSTGASNASVKVGKTTKNKYESKMALHNAS